MDISNVIYFEIQRCNQSYKNPSIDEILSLLTYRLNKTNYYDRSSNESSCDTIEEYDNLTLNPLIKSDIQNEFYMVPSCLVAQQQVNLSKCTNTLKRRPTKQKLTEEALDKKKVKNEELLQASGSLSAIKQQ